MREAEPLSTEALVHGIVGEHGEASPGNAGSPLKVKPLKHSNDWGDSITLGEESIHLLFSLENDEAKRMWPEYPYASMNKTSLLQMLATAFPDECPETKFCTDAFALTKAVEQLGLPVRLKTRGSCGRGVILVMEDGGRWKCESIYEEKSIQPKDLPALAKNYVDWKNPSFVVQREIPIARTSMGQTWELRCIATEDGPASAMEFPVAKLGKQEAHINNIAHGGEWVVGEKCRSLLKDIITSSSGWNDQLQITAAVETFLMESSELAFDIKELVDKDLAKASRTLVSPSHLKDPRQYERIIQTLFRSVAWPSDITGTWNKEKGKLQPMIIESQASILLPGEFRDRMSAVVSKRMLRKYEEFVQALKTADKPC